MFNYTGFLPALVLFSILLIDTINVIHSPPTQYGCFKKNLFANIYISTF